MYALSLLRKDNIKALTITTDTMDRYLHAAAAQVRDATIPLNKEYFDPRYDQYNRPAAAIAKVRQAHKRWEAMPSRREPITTAMLLDMIASCAKAPEHSLLAAHVDWEVLGHYYGFRRSEWCQDAHDVERGLFCRAPSGDLMATTFHDITFLGQNDYEFHDTAKILLTPDRIKAVRYRWRFQKNGENGATRTLLRNDACPALCPVIAAIRIMNRAIHASLKPTDPIAIYMTSPSASHSFITNRDVQRLVRASAKRVYNIKSASRLRLWSCHSMRVGACVQLYNSKHSPDKIQHLLRWKSATWRDYLRDCSSLSQSQLDGISSAAKKILEQKFISQFD